MAVLMTPPYLEFQDADGLPLTGGKVFTYAAGTSDPKAAFTDSTETVQLPNPIILDAAGRAVIWISGSYKFVITDSADNIIRTVDNVTSFNATAAASNSYFQSFSGNGSQTVFTLSTDLGTDENSIMVFIDQGGSNTVGNTPFFQSFNSIAAQTVFTVAQNLGTDPAAISVYVLDGAKGYDIKRPVTDFTISGTTLTLTVSPGAVSNAVLVFKNPILTGTTIGKGFEIQNPNTYTLSGTSLTFIAAPATGTNNIMVFAPSTLVGAAASSAAAAEGFADAANLSAVNAAASEVAAAASAVTAANQAASFIGTSTTSVTIGTGAKSFTTQTGKNFVVGEFITVAYSVSPANYMWGQVTSYNSGTGALNVNVITIGGSGTQASWTIALSGERGVQGPAISDGDKGDIIVSGGGNIWNVDTTVVATLTGAQALTNKSVNGVTPTAAGGGTNFLADDGTYKTVGGITLRTPIATTSGTSVDFNSIPPGVKRITMMLNSVSTNGSSSLYLQLGDSGGVETTGYLGSGFQTSANGPFTTGFGFGGGTAANIVSGSIVFNLLDASTNTWTACGLLGGSNAAFVYYTAGSKALSSVLDRVRLTTQAGADTFDGGSVSISYEL
ncbi:hypothetical protein LZD49_33465 [Dyadobacter sp. CY261]|uniref:hypothetical protein n=1 Tax=Dyadobacter sp. CY261 TaxID=2907203 RepID=UPI001F243F6C|nr:hypothetical protein [Dyadobacter sp. CY261]MCF0075436.1 hypothetical protein [Dyadobacter sp. CY261]